MTVKVKGPTQWTGAITGRSYHVPRGDTRAFEGPEGEHDPVPEDRVVSTSDKDTDSVPSRKVTASGSWKTFFEGGEEVGKAQCSKEEAQAWKNGTLTLDDIK